MALIPTTKSKISNLLSIITATHKTPSLASASYSNDAARKFRVAPFGGSGRSLSSSVAPLESDMVSLKDYEEYRKALYGGITHKALLVDAVGTLVLPSQPMAQIYRQIGEKYGVQYSQTEILNRYRRAYEQPWGRSRLRYVNDGRTFWQYIVSSSTGCSDSQYFEELYNYYTTEKVSFEALIGYNYFGVIECIFSPRGIKSEAWHLCDPDAEKVFKTLRNAGVKLAVVSNFDTRLRPVLRALNCDYWFDAVAVSAEVAAEKPNPTIFIKACELLGVKPEDAVHVGDDRRNDIWGARDAGCDAWLWGSDVHSFKEVCPICSIKVVSDMLSHITLQHGHLFKMQRRRRLRRVAIPNSQALSLLGRDLHEVHLQVLLGGSGYRSSNANSSNAVTDPFISFLILNFPSSESEDISKSVLSSADDSSVKSVTSSHIWKASFDPSLSYEEREKRKRQAAERAVFLQDLLVSTLLDD